MLEGGVPIFVDGYCVGAVGVSGVKSQKMRKLPKQGSPPWVYKAFPCFYSWMGERLR
jgi:hypothetical protein